MLNEKHASASWSNLYNFTKLLTNEYSTTTCLKALYCDEHKTLNKKDLSVHLNVRLSSPGFVQFKSNNLDGVETYFSSKEHFFQFDETSKSLFWEGETKENLKFKSYLFA